MEAIYKPNVFVINASAGHGKDTVKSIIDEYYSKHLMTSEKFSFAETAKRLCTVLIPETVLNMPEFSNMEPIELLEHLKDDRPDIEIFKGFNARKTLQYVLGNMFRGFSENIHIGWCAAKIHNKLIEHDFKIVFNCTDNRYENERRFLRTFNSINNNYDLIDFLRYQTSIINHNITREELDDSFKKTFGDLVSVNEPRVKKLLDLTKIELDNMNLPKPIKKWELLSPDLSHMNFEEGMESGFINVFRPIIDKDKDYKNSQDIINDIKEYTNLNDSQIEKIKLFYSEFGIELNHKNAKKYGYLRADPNHLSEKELNKLLTERVYNDPFDSEGNNMLKEKIFSFLTKKEQSLTQQNIQSKRRDTINISLPANLVLDFNHIEELTKLDISIYKDTIKNISKLGLVLDKGKFANIFNYTNALNILSEEEGVENPVPEFHMGIITRNSPYEARLLHQSLKHHSIHPEFMAFTNGKQRSEYNKQFSVDCVITHSAKSEKDHTSKNFVSVKLNSLINIIKIIEKEPTVKNIFKFYEETINIYILKQGQKANRNKVFNYNKKLKEMKKYFIENNLMEFSLEGFSKENKSKLGNYTTIFSEKDYRIKNPKELNIEFSKNLITKETTTAEMLIKKLNEIQKDNHSGLNINVFINSKGLSKMEKEEIEFLAKNKNIKIKIEEKQSDLHLTDNSKECKELNTKGKASITIENRKLNSKDIDKINKGPLRMLFDLDEVVVKDEETLFRLHSLRFFNSYQQNYYEIPLNKGPLFEAFYKFGKISKYYDEKLEANREVGKEKDINNKPISIAALTSRGGHFPCMRFMNFMEKNELFMDEALFMGGKDKTEHILYNMKLDGLVQFIDDHPIHVKRIKEAISKENIKNITVSQCVSGIHANTLDEDKGLEMEKEKVKKLLAKNENTKKTKRAP